jgi:DNA helicase-2/ATP-dependent DNA helicase PcrA
MSKYGDALQRLNEQQRRAVDQIDGPVLVVAGPGTGKTQLLTTRIAHILETTDALPQNILCLTFTESGVTAMRERLSNLIPGKAAYDVAINTYHAFGNDLIQRWPDYFMDFSDRQPIDELGIDSILRELITELPYSNPLKFADNYMQDVRSFINDCKQAGLYPDDVRAVAKQNISFLNRAAPIVSQNLGAMPRMSKASIGLFEKLYEQLSQLKTDTTSVVERVTPLSRMALQSLQQALEKAAETGNQKSLTGWKNDWLEKDADNNLTIAGKRAHQKLLAAADIYERYLAELDSRALYDYNDMILKAIEALKENPDFRFSIQERYLYILLDEFQDTNGAQLQLVQLLTNNPVNEGRADVLAVGDDDQAIYAFQGADNANMRIFQDSYRDVLPITLVDNYRSQSGILQLAHGIAEQIETRIIRDKTLVPQAKPNAAATIERVEAKSDIEQFGWITKRIEQLKADGVPLNEIAILAPKHRYLEPLVSFLHAAHIPLHYEKRENILDDPAVNELITMSKLVLALSNNAHGQADTLWPEVLSYDCWGLSTSRIWQLSWQASDEHRDWTSILLESELQPLALFFIRLSNLCGSESLEMMLDYLIGTRELDLHESGKEELFSSPFYEHYFGEVMNAIAEGPQQALALDEPATRYGKFWELLTNLTVLRARLADYRADEAVLRLPDLLEFVNAHRAADIKVLNTSPYQEATEAVQLMTAYKSKGLEFEVVFVIACNDDVWGNSSRGAGNRISLPPNLQYIRYDGATNDEHIRLFYVALTRAKAQLYLVNYASTYSGKAATRLRYLEEQADDTGTIHSPLLPEDAQTVIPASTNVQSPPAAELTAYWRGKHHAALSHETTVNMICARLNSYQLSPTAVGQFTDLEHGGPEAFLLYNLLHFPRAVTPELQYGNAMHETLQWIHLRNKDRGTIPSLAACLEKFESRLQTRQLVPQTLEQLKKRGTPVLAAYLEQRAHTISADNECEYNFRNEGVFIGKAHMSGKIDKLIIDKQHKSLIIVDYKTGASHSTWQHSIKLHKYLQQLYLYKLLVERSHTFAGYSVTDAYVEFVEPDENGHIQELHMSFEPEEQAKLEQLTEVIWELIHTLKLPNVSEFRNDIMGTEAFETSLIASYASDAAE